jgi:FkbM family methyltransferase
MIKKILKKMIQKILELFHLKLIKLRSGSYKTQKNLIVKNFFPICSNSIFYTTSTATSELAWILGVINNYKLLARKIDKNFNWYNYDFTIDIGAHIGVFTKIAELNNSKVISIEPDKKNFMLLKKNFLNNKNVKLINGAICNDSTKKNIFYIGKTSSSGSIIKNEIRPTTLAMNYTVRSIKFKDLLNETTGYKKILLKFDIEGSEWLVLNELKEFLKLKKIKGVFGELHKIKEGQQYYKIKNDLKSLGFKSVFQGHWERDSRVEFYAYR